MQKFLFFSSEEPGAERRQGMARFSSWEKFPADQRRWSVAGPAVTWDEGERRTLPPALSKKAVGCRWLSSVFPWLNKLRQQRERQPAPERRGCDGAIVPLAAAAAEFLRGRQLTELQLHSYLEEQGHWPADIAAALDYGSFYGLWETMAGLEAVGWQQLRCRRCGGTDIGSYPCAVCGRSHCGLCLECQALGPVRQCTRLHRRAWDHNQRPEHTVAVNFRFPLTSAQRRASQFLENFTSSAQQKAMVWAACGAGKTETVFAAMAAVLNRGGRVLFAIPRRDVVLDLEARLRDAFPSLQPAVLYGGQPWAADAPLVAATTHQVLRFYRSFDLVVLDEVDAFPYHGSEMLRRAMAAAVKAAGKRIEMTATPLSWPPPCPHTTIPARYHGRPLPLPQWIRWSGSLWSSSAFSIPRQVMQMLTDESPWIVFVPTKAACPAVAGWLQRNCTKTVEFCHSQSPGRDGAVKRLKDGHLDIVVATSILERGITVAGVQTAVLWADHPVFSSRALVQMAGRVGRRAAKPNGCVLFLAARRSTSIQQACRDIALLNQEAEAAGLLQSERTVVRS